MEWSFPVLLTLSLAATASIYLRGWFRVRAADPHLIPGSRAAAFIMGLAVVWLAVGSPLVTLDHQLLTFHMVKHLLLMTVAAPLILLGTPALLFKPLRHRPLNWSARALALFWLAGTATVIGWHTPAAFQLALGSHTWHNVQNATFLLAGLLFWWPVIEPWPGASQAQWSVPIYLFLATLPCDILSALLAFCGRVVYPSYFASSALDDQQLAGALMWVAVTFVYLIPAVVITIRILSPRAQSSEIKATA